jgi:opacity protein-like surface antigen
MKKMMLLMGVLLVITAAACAQESRQEASISYEGIAGPQVYGNAVTQTSTIGGGFLASYRYMVTPRSSIEANYGWAHNSQKFSTSSLSSGRVHTRQQEISGAYVYSRNYHNFNPFLEAGVGALIFSALEDSGTSFLDAKRQTTVGGLFGGGVAYELSPSFDLRLEYRGLLAKAPDFKLVSGANNLNTSRYEWYSAPVFGIAYHF